MTVGPTRGSARGGDTIGDMGCNSSGGVETETSGDWRDIETSGDGRDFETSKEGGGDGGGSGTEMSGDRRDIETSGDGSGSGSGSAAIMPSTSGMFFCYLLHIFIYVFYMSCA